MAKRGIMGSSNKMVERFCSFVGKHYLCKQIAIKLKKNDECKDSRHCQRPRRLCIETVRKEVLGGERYAVHRLRHVHRGFV